MLYIVLADGTVDELPEATGTVHRDDTLACLDSNGRQVKSYERKDVVMFSRDERVRRHAIEAGFGALKAS